MYSEKLGPKKLAQVIADRAIIRSCRKTQSGTLSSTHSITLNLKQLLLVFDFLNENQA